MAAHLEKECLPYVFENPPMTLNEVVQIKNQVIEDLFPRLKNVSIRMNTKLKLADYFMDTWITPHTVLRHALKRRYWIRINRRLLKSPPSADALYAILAHELSHIADYKKRNSVQLIRFLKNIAKNDPAPYERHTDEVALKKGVARGLL